MSRPAWFTAAILAMLAGLMGSHLWMLRVGVRECDELFRVQLEQARRLAAKQEKQATILPLNSECNNVEDDYSNVADKYLNVILALLGGAGVAGGIAAQQSISDRKGSTSTEAGTAPQSPQPGEDPFNPPAVVPPRDRDP